ncbi:MAG: pitrilysin family protein, partial [Bacteroidota bacterium]
MKKLLLSKFIFLFALSMVFGQSDPMYKIPVDPAVRSGKLENGMHYYIQKNKKPENRAELRLALKAGATSEDDDQRGIAHFVEHMAFNGTKNFKKNELVDYLESVGSKFGPDLNAYTSFDETVYMLQARTDTFSYLDKGLLILEDWASAVTFEDEEIDKERGVVESEWRSGLGPDQRMFYKYLPIVYKDSRYAERLPIGDPETINNVSYETVRRFYKDWYRPDLMSVIVVGDIDVDTIEKEIKERFTILRHRTRIRYRCWNFTKSLLDFLFYRVYIYISNH